MRLPPRPPPPLVLLQPVVLPLLRRVVGMTRQLSSSLAQSPSPSSPSLALSLLLLALTLPLAEVGLVGWRGWPSSSVQMRLLK
jgi:hypothetical protein